MFKQYDAKIMRSFKINFVAYAPSLSIRKLLQMRCGKVLSFCFNKVFNLKSFVNRIRKFDSLRLKRIYVSSTDVKLNKL